MLPFDVVFYLLSVMIALAVTSYFTLLLRFDPSNLELIEAKPKVYTEKTEEKNAHTTAETNRIVSQPTKTVEPPEETETEEKECAHYVGYLTTLPKGGFFPDECFGCRKVIQCLKIQPAKVIESFYVTGA